MTISLGGCGLTGGGAPAIGGEIGATEWVPLRRRVPSKRAFVLGSNEPGAWPSDTQQQFEDLLDEEAMH